MFAIISLLLKSSPELPCSSYSKERACNADLALIPGSGRSPGEGHGNPLQYSCLENPMDRGALWATQSMGSQNQTQLSDYAQCLPHLCPSCEAFLQGLTQRKPFMNLPDKRQLLPSSSSQLPVLSSVNPPFIVIKLFPCLPHKATSSRKINSPPPCVLIS